MDDFFTKVISTQAGLVLLTKKLALAQADGLTVAQLPYRDDHGYQYAQYRVNNPTHHTEYLVLARTIPTKDRTILVFMCQCEQARWNACKHMAAVWNEKYLPHPAEV